MSERTKPAFRDRMRRAGFVAVNVWLVYHLIAIVVAPASVPPSSALVRNAWRGFSHYLQLFHLNHGYHFFAPEPGPGSFVVYRVERADGTAVEGRFPDRAIWPRLLYHRHFMLSEQFDTVPERPVNLRGRWVRSVAKHLCHEHGGVRVELIRVRHLLPRMDMVRNGVRLDDPESYANQPLGEFRCEEL